MAKKTPEQLAKEFEGRKAKGLAKGGAAFWPNVLSNAVLKLVAAGEVLSVEALIGRIEQDSAALDIQVKAGADEAIARLKQAVAKAS
ncbi:MULTISPECIES: hypothetical protein [unclassified Bosea (in: a-proteobacteria)]|uniref:hypothetical protein n=1 Tax=unclassified Bosea (in: a-proteobacteria) TaxID=2653178 RepID=UPI000F755779|nr:MULTISPECIES: hypothetical protein [unclassified Bosea (in: a-proteobacteria)]AZO80934.1 hypothetical protein BLM15_27715 [Bosea sp. Tri-49]RXT25901.1 hypothetical protein B5U98_04875 [Bosea sp. Tri-39]RXT31143.1 hypothetical protein B5U99_20420 [Bosea sp. Tri-54]